MFYRSTWLLGVLVLPSFISAIPRPTWDASSKVTFNIRRTVTNGTCPAPITEHTTAARPSPFQPLTEGEIKSLVSWLSADEQGLNLTDAENPELAMSDNYIWHLEELKPNKTDVLAYFDNGTPFSRYARVVINQGGKAEPDVTEYYVGPLPISPETRIRTLDYMYNGQNGPKVLFNGRFADNVRQAGIDKHVSKVMSGIADITQDLLGLEYHGAKDERSTMTYFVTNPVSKTGAEASVWSTWRRLGSSMATYSKPTDLAIRWDLRGTDPDQYRLEMIVFSNEVYLSVEDFRTAWKSGNIERRPIWTDDESFLFKDRKGLPRPLEERLAPTITEPDGKRYKVDTNNKYVEYMGWKFYTRFDRDVGIQFYDIKFKDERILFELSLPDAIAQYSGNDPFQASTAYMDRYYGIGAQAGRLIPGYDCPYHATYWNSDFTVGTSPVSTNNSICIFEADIGTPITRHTESYPGSKLYMHSTKGSKLIVRMIATVGNYDYLWDYAFFVDGTITVDAYASGYVQATYYRPEDKGQWGPRMQEFISGTLHTHVMNFKADFDLIDTANSFVQTDIVVENITQPWFPELGEFEMMRYKTTTLQTEDEGLNLPPITNGQTMFTVENTAHKNKWGQSRGYRILPGLSNVHLNSKTNPFFLKSAQFAKQPFAVSRQHDTEPDASAALNQNVPSTPLVEFWKFFNGEDLVQQDLVAWVNLGMQHYTRAEDMPNTLISEAHSSIMFAPQNWGNAELTQDLQNAVIYNGYKTPQGQTVMPETNGVEPPVCFYKSPQDGLVGVWEGTEVPDPFSKNA